MYFRKFEKKPKKQKPSKQQPRLLSIYLFICRQMVLHAWLSLILIFQLAPKERRRAAPTVLQLQPQCWEHSEVPTHHLKEEGKSQERDLFQLVKIKLHPGVV